ncbi:MAG: hypothetical protein ABFC77_01085 [Thermoguttaceae bacterium]
MAVNFTSSTVAEQSRAAETYRLQADLVFRFCVVFSWTPLAGLGEWCRLGGVDFWLRPVDGNVRGSGPIRS